MILTLPKVTEEQYLAVKSDFYKKPNIPEIELELENLQKELLLKENYTVLPEFKQKVSVYAKSILLKQLKGSTDYIDPEMTEVLADQAADNFIKRYFRLENPVVGASFAGILIFKVKEVLSHFFKGIGIESKVSIDSYYGGDESSNNVLTVEQKLAFDIYEKNQDNVDIETVKDLIYTKIEKEYSLLNQLNKKGLGLKFLKYIIYIIYLQQEKQDKKLNLIANQALKLVEKNEAEQEKLAPYLESALLDIQYT